MKKKVSARVFAREAGISYPVVLRWIEVGKIKAVKDDYGFWRISVAEVEKYKKKQNKPKKGRPPKKKPGA